MITVDSRFKYLCLFFLTFFPVEIFAEDESIEKMPQEGNSDHVTHFLLELNRPLSVDASVNYYTIDGTAIAGMDYISTSGTATILKGQTSVKIPVKIIGDSFAEPDETFKLVITNPQGGIFPENITKITAIRTIIDDDSTSPLISVFSDSKKVEELKIDYLEKLHNFSGGDNNDTQEKIELLKSEIEALEEKLDQNQKDIIALGGAVS